MTVDNTIRLKPGSSGSFLCPPGHPMHFHKIWAGTDKNPTLIAGLDYALRNEYGDVPERIVAQVQKLYDEATLVRSEQWERQVYAYFGNCYSPDGVDRNVSRCLIVGMAEKLPRDHPDFTSGKRKWSEYESLNTGDIVQPDDPRCVPEHHLAYLLVREYFPDAEPRLDLIEHRPRGGSRPCRKCGKTVQYEARFDDWAEFLSSGGFHTGYRRECEQGGYHEIQEDQQ